MNILLIIIIILILFLIADHIGVFSKSDWIIPLICFCSLVYFYPLIMGSIAAVVGVIWSGFALINLPTTLHKKTRAITK